MKYMKRYFIWKQMNEELEDKTVLSAADKLDDEGFEKRANEIRNKLVPNFDQKFEFYFLPQKVKSSGGLTTVTCRAVVDNRETAFQLSKIIKTFFKLDSAPRVNNLWTELENKKAQSGLMTINYDNNNGVGFSLKAKDGQFVSSVYDRNDEFQVLPMILIYDRPMTFFVARNKTDIDYGQFKEYEPRQVIKIKWDATDNCLKADIQLNLSQYDDSVRNVLKNFELNDDKTQKVSTDDSDEKVREIKDILVMSSQRPEHAFQKFVELTPDEEFRKFLMSEVSFIIRPVSMDATLRRSNLSEFELKSKMRIYEHQKLYICYAKNQKDAEFLKRLLTINQLILGDRNVYSKINADNLVSETMEGDIEVKAKLRLDEEVNFTWEFDKKEYFKEATLLPSVNISGFDNNKGYIFIHDRIDDRLADKMFFVE